METRLILPNNILELFLELRWYLIKVGVSEPDLPQQILIGHLPLSCCHQFGQDHPLRFWVICCGILTRLILSTCSRCTTLKVIFEISPLAYHTYSKSVCVILYSRIGGISISQTQFLSDIHSTIQIKFSGSTDSLKRLSFRIFRKYSQFIMESIHRQVVNYSGYAKVPSSIQRTAIQQFH